MATRKTRKRRGRTQHPGVTLVSPRGSHWFRLRWICPDTGKTRWESLDRALNREQCVEVAKRKSQWRDERIRELAMGALPLTNTTVPGAIKVYFERNETQGLRERTRAIYRTAADKLEAWCKAEGIASTDELTAAKLNAFRDHLIGERKRAPVEGAKGRGTFAPTAETRSPAAVDQDLRAVGTILRALRARHLLPKLSAEDITANTKRPRSGKKSKIDFLMPADCGRLLEAALRHDGQRVIGREDEQRLREQAKSLGIPRAAIDASKIRGTTPRYAPVAEFVATVLLSGMRYAEAANLRWDQIDLEAVDASGKAIGTIYLSCTDTKTNADRTIYLNVCPTLRELLARMRLRSGGKGKVFGSGLVAGAKRLVKEYGAPEFNYQKLRRTTATYLAKAPSIYGSAAHANAAHQLGHSSEESERRYRGTVVPIPQEARTLEAAMQVEGHMAKLLAAVGRTPVRALAAVE